MSTNRRKFLEKFAQLGTLTTLPVLATEAAPGAVLEEKNRFVAGPYLQNLLSDEITIMWITHKNSLSWVEYGEGAYLSKKAFAYQDGL
ncbi:MAG: metallophosphoesterase, partial [Runella zeae]